MNDPIKKPQDNKNINDKDTLVVKVSCVVLFILLAIILIFLILSFLGVIKYVGCLEAHMITLLLSVMGALIIPVFGGDAKVDSVDGLKNFQIPIKAGGAAALFIVIFVLMYFDYVKDVCNGEKNVHPADIDATKYIAKIKQLKEECNLPPRGSDFCSGLEAEINSAITKVSELEKKKISGDLEVLLKLAKSELYFFLSYLDENNEKSLAKLEKSEKEIEEAMVLKGERSITWCDLDLHYSESDLKVIKILTKAQRFIRTKSEFNKGFLEQVKYFKKYHIKRYERLEPMEGVYFNDIN